MYVYVRLKWRSSYLMYVRYFENASNDFDEIVMMTWLLTLSLELQTGYLTCLLLVLCLRYFHSGSVMITVISYFKSQIEGAACVGVYIVFW